MKARELLTWAALALLAWRLLHLESRLAGAEAMACQTGAASICQTVNVTLCPCAGPEVNASQKGVNLPSSRGFPVSGFHREK
jgi:hypothetical protein